MKPKFRLAPRKLAMRDRLVLDHLKLPQQIARKLVKSLPPCFEMDDLIQAGMLGLLEAAGQFDPVAHPGVAFGAFARRRIKGEIQESIGVTNSEKKDRSTRRRRWEEATRPPIAECSEVSRLRPCVADVPAIIEDGLKIPRETRDPRARADTAIEQRELADLAREAIAVLPPRIAKVIEMHYGAKNRELKQIAGTEGLKVGAARVSQLHTEGLLRMKEHFRLKGRLKLAA